MKAHYRNRIIGVDYMKAFSIIAVVLNHTFLKPEIKTAVYLVCLPAFFFVSGLFANTQLKPLDFFKKKTLRLLIPYLIFGLLSWLAWLFIGRKYGADAESETTWWLPITGIILGKEEMLVQNPPLWFLCCLIILEWIYYGICQVSQKWLKWLIIVSITILGCLLSYLRQNWIWEISAAFIILPIYAWGAQYTKKETNVKSIALLLIFFASLSGVYVGYMYNGDIALHNSHIGNPFIFYITIASVVGLWFSISHFLEKYLGTIRPLQYIGENTLIILCTHIPLFGAIKGFCMLYGVPLAFFNTNIGSIILWISTLLLSFPLIYIINNFCPLIIGKKMRTNP